MKPLAPTPSPIPPSEIENVNITGSEALATPSAAKALLPAPQKSLATVLESRRAIRDILDGKDGRLLLIVGPCSIHDTKAAIEYASRLKKLSERVRGKFLVVMRVYFEKPRTATGWKGLVNDPFLNDSFRIEEGLTIARKLLIAVTETGLPTATEFLNPLTPQYLADLVSWAAIGARTTESQTHREMASGLSMPVGIKNGTDGAIAIAVNALKAVGKPHHFLGVNEDGRSAVFATRGNPYAHIVMRGGGGRANYDRASLAECEAELERNALRRKIVVDCSHANAGKNPDNQVLVFEDCIGQIRGGNFALAGLMMESHLFAGNQPIPEDPARLRYGVSITDKCLDWETTEKTIRES